MFLLISLSYSFPTKPNIITFIEEKIDLSNKFENSFNSISIFDFSNESF